MRPTIPVRMVRRRRGALRPAPHLLIALVNISSFYSRRSYSALCCEGFNRMISLDRDEWIPWMKTIPDYVVPSKAPFQEMIVPTIDSIRYTYLLDAHTQAGRHILFTGNTGTGKTVNISQYLSTMRSDFMPISMMFSAATSSNQTQDILDSKMEKRRQRVYGSAAVYCHKRMTYECVV